MVPLEYTKKTKIIVVRQMPLLQYKALNSKFNFEFNAKSVMYQYVR